MPSPLTTLLEEVDALHEALRVHRERLAAAASSTPAQWATLAAAGNGESVSRIARKRGLTRQSVQRTADALVSAALARYAANPHHRRSPTLTLTPEGASLLERLENSMARAYASLGDSSDREDIDGAVLVLRAVRDEVERL